ncbi:MAG: hypothetical protein AB3X44_09260 [Leptothrix sp. (in: b-proteobacteria)]
MPPPVFDRSLRRKVTAAAILILVLLVAPICVYVYKFGWNISGNHGRWGEMGSAMSGLYTPILSLLTIWVLAAQVRLQSDMNKHAFDQAYVQEARSDVQYYLSRLVQELAVEFDNGSAISGELIDVFAYASAQELCSQQYAVTAQALNRRFSRIMSIWSAYYSRLEGLRTNSHHPYEHNFTAAKEMAIVLLSYEGCVALDNFVWCVSEGRLKYEYQFSTGLGNSPDA